MEFFLFPNFLIIRCLNILRYVCCRCRIFSSLIDLFYHFYQVAYFKNQIPGYEQWALADAKQQVKVLRESRREDQIKALNEGTQAAIASLQDTILSLQRKFDAAVSRTALLEQKLDASLANSARMVEAVEQINRLLRHQAHQYFLLQHPPQQQQQLQQHQGLPAPIQPPQAQEPPLPPPPPHAAPPAVDAQPAALHDAAAAQRAAVARDAVGVLRRTPRVPAIGGRCPSTWEASHQEWELCELSTFLLHDQKGWPRVSRTRYNKRRAIHEELLRMSLSRLDLDLAGVASWLDDIRGERTLTNHLVSIRQNNP